MIELAVAGSNWLGAFAATAFRFAISTPRIHGALRGSKGRTKLIHEHEN